MRLGINKKLVGSFFLGILFAAVFIVWSFFTIEDFISTLDEIDTLTLRVERTDDLNFHIQELVTTSSEYLVTGNLERRDELDRVINEITTILSELEAEEGDIVWNAMSANVRIDAQKISEMAVDIVFTDNPVGNTVAASLMNEVTALGHKLIGEIEAVNSLASSSARTLKADKAKWASDIRVVLYAFPLAGLLLLLFLYFYLMKYISSPITDLYEGAVRLSRGDFSEPVKVITNDELGDLAKEFNVMAAALKEREVKLLSLFKVVDKANRDLVAANHYKSTFLANVSHELKTPLTHILGFSELLKLKADADLPASSKEYISNIKTSGEELLKLIEDILDVTKSAGNTVMNLEKFDLSKVVEVVVGRLTPRAEDKGVSIEIDLGFECEGFWADEYMLTQILFNILDNAVKFTSSGGEVGLKVFEADSEDAIVFKVFDNGIGISEELQAKLFTPFSIGEDTLTRDYDGVGIGLALTKRFVEFHNGSIKVLSKVGLGTTVEFTMPCKADEDIKDK
ncbi:MAG: HAMP domain-containing protein [Deltaproteobacteria bacterium]|nr:HAMP domain-containing protein [Deltaproteobacteria bacterium]